MGAQRLLGLQLCLMVTSYFQRHTPTSQIENSKYDCPRLHRIWNPNTMEPREKIKGFEIIVFGQILPHKIGVSDLRSPNSPIQFRYTPNTIPIKDGLSEKNPVCRNRTHVPTCQKITWISLSYRGGRLCVMDPYFPISTIGMYVPVVGMCDTESYRERRSKIIERGGG